MWAALRPGPRLRAALASPVLPSLVRAMSGKVNRFQKKVCRGRKMVMNRAYRGLFGGKHIQFGNTISFSENKTRRTWKPNVKKKSFWSETYQRMLHFKMTTSVIKLVKRLPNGIDEYLMKTRDDHLLYPKAIRMKKNMLRLHLRSGQMAMEQPDLVSEIESSVREVEANEKAPRVTA